MFWSKNRFRGKCYRCGKKVEAGEGSHRYVDPTEVGRKRVGVGNTDIDLLEHHECREKYEGTDVSYRYNPVPEDG